MLKPSVRSIWMGGALTALLALAPAAGARAGTYQINNCPAAPVPNGNSGPWTVFGSPQDAKGTCSGGAGDYIGPRGGRMNPGETAGVQISAPPGSGITIRGAEIWWYVPGEIAGADTFAQAARNGGIVAESDTPLDKSTNPDKFTLPSSTKTLTLKDYCSADDGTNGCTFGSGENDILQLFGSQLTLEDNSLPSGNVTGGALAGSGSVSGTQGLTYTASDPNSGVRAVDLLVDGQQVARNDYASRCPYQSFLACPTTVSDSISWNTGTVGAGAHEVALEIESAAKDTAIIDDHVVAFGPAAPSPGPVAAAAGTQIGPGSPLALRGQANGTNASDQARLSARWTRTGEAAITIRYGVRRRVTGRLTTFAGQAISDASIDVYETPAYGGARTRSLAVARTGPAGAWSVTLPRGISSSMLRFVYRSHVNDTIPVATAALTLRVHSLIGLRIRPRVTSVGRTIHFSGVLRGLPIPPGGKQLVLEASSGREWIQFDTIRTDARGHYHASYRFKFPGPVIYRFRVISPFEADFPFLKGISRAVAVHEL